MRSVAWWVVVTWIAAGCDGGPAPAHSADGGAPADAALEDAAPGAHDAGSDSGPAAPSPGFARISVEILGPRCTGCHDGRTVAPGPDLRGDGAYDRIVSVASEEVGVVALVEPGDPDASYLYRKVEGTHLAVCDALGRPRLDCGEQMPRGPAARPLEPAELGLVRDWIAGGATR